MKHFELFVCFERWSLMIGICRQVTCGTGVGLGLNMSELWAFVYWELASQNIGGWGT